MKQCLMILTKDQNKFFTHEKNFPQLVEFSKIFNAEISTVQIPNETEILDLEELAPALCEKKSQKTNYKILQIKLKSKAKKKSTKIRNYIEGKLLKGNVVSLKGLKTKYSYLSNACLCIYFAQTREKLIKEGHIISKVGGGKYKINK